MKTEPITKITKLLVALFALLLNICTVSGQQLPVILDKSSSNSYRDASPSRSEPPLIVNTSKSMLAPVGSIAVNENALYNTFTPEQLVQNVLISGCINVSNITFNRTLSANVNQRQLGYFEQAGSLFPMTEGLVLSSGYVTSSEGPNNSPNSSNALGLSGDPDLDLLAGASSQDAAVLEFDFIPSGDQLEFKYIFSSEEYLEYCCSAFNDAFGFFLSGPGISGPYSLGAENIALLPSTTIPVAINNVHSFVASNHYGNPCPAQNPGYYIDNPIGTLTTQFDGMTVILTATYTLTRCVPYHIKLAVGDIADDKLNSAVFLQARSFSSSPPVIIPPNDTTIECGSSTDPSVLGWPDISNNCILVNVSYSDLITVRTCAGDITITRTWTVTDACGNMATCEQIISETDNTAPSWDDLPGSLDITVPCDDVASSWATTPTGTDICGSTVIPPPTDVITPGSCPGNYIITRTWSLADDCGNAALDFIQIITVIDNVAPTWDQAPGSLDVTVSCDDPTGLGTALGITPTATDNCSLVIITGPVVVNTPGSCLNNYTITRTWTLADNCGNTGIPFVQTITVQDIAGPVLHGVPANITIQCDDAVPAPPVVTATDNCGPNPAVTMTQVTTAGTCPDSYSITRTWTATDLCSNTGTLSQVITVIDNTPPVIITCALPQTTVADALCQATVPDFTPFVTATDNCSPAAWLIITQSPPAGTVVGIGVTIITITVTDLCNNHVTCTTTFTVTPEPAPVVITQPSDEQICLGANASFSITASGTGTLFYQWQVNTGFGWVNLANGGVYSGVFTSTLNITSAPFSMNGYHYRCIVHTCSQQVISNIVTLTIYPALIAGTAIANQSICYSSTPAAIQAFAPTGGDGTYSYQWQVSTDNITFVNIPGANTLTYSPGVLSQTTFYRLIQISGSGCGTVTTNSVRILVLPDLFAGVASADQTICYNAAPSSISATAPSGGNGSYTYQWEISTDNISFLNIPGANALIYSPGTLSQTTYFRLIQTSGGGCGSVITNIVTITVDPDIIPGVVTASQTICYNTTPAPLVATALTGGNGTSTNHWQSSTDNVTFNNIAGGNSLIYAPGPLTVTTYFRIRQTSGSGCGSMTSNVVTITVYPDFIPGTASADQAICSNFTPATIHATPPTGGDGIYTYQWQVSTDNITFINIPGENALAYSPGVLTQTTYYRLSQASGSGCGTDVTNVVTISVAPNLVAGSAIADQTLCFGDVPAPLTATSPVGGNGVYTYQWEISTDNIIFNIIPGENGLSFAPAALTTTTWYRLSQTSGGGCGTVYTNVVTITVNPDLIAGIASADQVICFNTAPAAITATPPAGGDGVYTYQWQKSTDNITFNNIPSANGLSYSPGPLSVTTYFRLRQTSGSGCGTVTTNVVVITVNPALIAGTASANQTICYNSTPAPVNATPPTGGDGDYTYQWQVSTDNISFSNISGANALSYSPGLLLQTTYYRLKQTSGSSCGMVMTNVVTITVNPMLVAGTASADQTICYGTDPSPVIATVATGGDGSYSYQWQVSTDNITFSNIPGATSWTYSPVGLTQTTWYRQTQASGSGCGTVTTNVVTITVNPDLLPGIISADQTICINTLPATLTATTPTGGDGSYTFQWQVSTNNITFNNIPGANSMTYSPGPLSIQTWYRQRQTSGSGCGTVTTNVVVISIYPQPSVTGLTIPVCSDAPTGVIFSPGTGAPATSYIINSINSNGLPSFEGNPATGTGFPANEIADDAWTNPTSSSVDVVYTVIPVSADGCPGAQFTVTIQVQAEPVVAGQALTLCSDMASGLVLNASTTIAVAGYNITNISSGSFTASAGNPVTGTGFSANALADDAWTNTGIVPANVIYTIVPVAASGCPGNPFTVILTINPEPVVDSQVNDFACSGSTTGIILGPGSNIPATSYNIISINSNGLTATAGNPATGTGFPADVLADDQWSNTTPAAASVIYTIVPVSTLGCLGNAFTVTIQVNPDPITDFTANTACWNDTTFFTVSGNFILGISLWQWDFGDGTSWMCNSPGCATDPHVFPFNGTYPVTLHVTDTNGCEYEVTHMVTVLPRPVAFFSYDTPDCTGTSIQFTDLSQSPGDPVYTFIRQWEWSFGDGTPVQTVVFPADPNLLHTYAAPGTYEVILKITNSHGCTDSDTLNITVTNNPVADFTHDPICEDAAATFTDISTENGGGAIISWSWDFGDPGSGINNFSGLQNPTHTFGTPGNFVVTFVAFNFNGCGDTLQKVVTVKASPDANFSSTAGCVGQPTSFSANLALTNPGAIASCLWNFGDGSTANTPLATHNYSAPGIYTVILTLTDTAGCEGIHSDTITVTIPPVAHFSVNPINCFGEPVLFSDLSVAITGYISSWTWDFGDGNTQTINHPATPDQQHNYLLPGIYNVTLTVVNSEGCSAQEQVLVTINPGPVAGFTYQLDCGSGVATFSDISTTTGSTSITAWTWNFGDPASGVNNISGIQNPSHTYSANGSYIVSLITSTANACSDTVTQVITISPAPAVAFTAQGGCQGTATQFSPDATGMNLNTIASYSWNFGDGSTSMSQVVDHMYNIPGSYNVTLTVTDTAGCSNAVTHILQIDPLPLTNFDFTPLSCEQSVVHFNDLTTVQTGYIVSRTWDFGDGTSQSVIFPAISNINHTYANTGTFDVTLTTITDNGCSNQVTKTLSILARPAAAFTHGSGCEGLTVSFTDQSAGSGGFGITQRTWNFGDPLSGTGNTSTLEDPLHFFTNAGSYTIMLIVSNVNGCSDTATQVLTIAAPPAVNFSSLPACAGSSTPFTSSTFVNMASTQNWSWQFGDGGTSATADPGHTYIQPGTFTVTLTITDISGCTNTISNQVIIPAGPFANFGSNAPTCAGSPVTFNDLSNGNGEIITLWQMDFGDGTDTTLTSVPSGLTHIYANSGNFTVTLTVETPMGCPAVIQHVTTVSPAPVAAFSHSGSCGTALFTDQSALNGGTGITGWQWNFGDPASGTENTSTLGNPAHTYTTSGNFTVTLLVTNASGCTNSIQSQITIPGKPPVDFLISNASCLGMPASFHPDASVTDIASIAVYSWNFGDGSVTSSEQNPVHTYNTSGIYTVTLSVTDTSGCGNSQSHNVSFYDLPTAGFSYTSSCGNNITQFTDHSFAPSGDIITGWDWNFGDPLSGSNTSTLKNPEHNYANAGTYYVTQTVYSSTGCSGSVTLTVKIWSNPTAHFTYIASPCSNGEVLFQDSSYSEQSTITDWQWEFEPYQYSSGQSATHQFYYADSCYNVRLIVTNSRGCVDTTMQQVCVPAPLAVTFDHQQWCFGSPMQFIPKAVTPVGHALQSFSWNFGDPASGNDNTSGLGFPEHIFTNPGFYTVYLTSTDQYGCSATTSGQVEIKTLPTASFTHIPGLCDNTIHFTSTSSDAFSQLASYTWNYGDGISETFAAPVNTASHQYAVPGIYEVTLSVANVNSCTDSKTVTVQRDACLIAAFLEADTLKCQNNAISFNEMSTCDGTISQWQWNWGDNSQPTVYNTFRPSVIHTFAEPGYYNVTLVITTLAAGTPKTATKTISVRVMASPLARFVPSAVCLGGTNEFRNTTFANGADALSYKWDFGVPMLESDTSRLENPEYNYTSSGSFNASLIVTNETGCTDTVNHIVKVNSLPSAAFGYDLACPGHPTIFISQADSSMPPITKWKWLVSDSLPIDGMAGATAAYTFSKQGTYAVQLSVIDTNGCADTSSLQVIVDPAPVSAFSITENFDNEQGRLQLTNGSVDATNYYWDFGNGSTSTAESPVVLYQANGRYLISLIAENRFGCIDSTSVFYEFLIKGLYIPNAFAPGGPEQAVRSFKPVGVNLEKYKIEVYDTFGNLIWRSTELDETGAPTEGWDGTFKGKMCQQDVYVWKVFRAIFRDGTIWNNNDTGTRGVLDAGETFGTVTLIR